jgi:hypothetical protein
MIYCTTRCILSGQISLEAYDSEFVTISFIFINYISKTFAGFFFNKNLTLTPHSVASTESQAKYVKNDSFPWPLVVPALSISAFWFLLTCARKIFISYRYFKYKMIDNIKHCIPRSSLKFKEYT